MKNYKIRLVPHFHYDVVYRRSFEEYLRISFDNLIEMLNIAEKHSEYTEPIDYFNYEMENVGADTTFQLPSKIIEETDEYTIVQGNTGATYKNWKNQTSTPEWIDFLIKDRKTWEEYKPKLAMNKTRFDWISAKNVFERAKTRSSMGKYCCICRCCK